MAQELTLEIPILQDLAILFGLSIVVAWVCLQLKLPVMIGYLATGLALGPFGFQMIHQVHDVEMMAEIGIILLLFAIGLEFSFENLNRIKKVVFIGGPLQMLLTSAAIYGIAVLFGLSTKSSIFIGLVVALSSTAIVLKLYGEKGWMDSPHGQNSLALLIFQDIAIVPLMLLTPVLAGVATDGDEGLWVLLGKIALILVGVVVLARYIVPAILFRVAKTRNRELFLLTVCAIGLGVAWATNQAGLSLGLGAFLAGLIISESEYSTYALSSILPFRDVFSSLFFISIGMLLNLAFFWQHIGVIVVLSLVVVMCKAVVTGFVARVLKLPVKTSVILGLSLAQVGEFSFVLAKSGLEFKLLDPQSYQMFLSLAVLTMAMTPLLISNAPALARQFAARMPNKLDGREELEGASESLENHLIIIGYGVTGNMLAKAAKEAGTEFIVLEMNADTVRIEQAKGLPIYFGDSTHPEVLEHLGVHRARTMTVAISDPLASLATVKIAKELNPALYIISRSRFVKQLEPTLAAGADEVVSAEYEAAVEIFARVLHQYMIPQDKIEGFIGELRADGYQRLRSVEGHKAGQLNLKEHLQGLEIRTLVVGEQRSPACHTLRGLNLRFTFGVTALAIRSKGVLSANPSADDVICPGDEIMLLGEPAQLAQTAAFLNPPEDFNTPMPEET